MKPTKKEEFRVEDGWVIDRRNNKASVNRWGLKRADAEQKGVTDG